MIDRLLFFGTLGMSMALISEVLLNSWLPLPSPLPRLFAEDQTVRHTALASGLGLIVTAFVFFRAGLKGKKTRRPPPSVAAGA